MHKLFLAGSIEKSIIINKKKIRVDDSARGCLNVYRRLLVVFFIYFLSVKEL